MRSFFVAALTVLALGATALGQSKHTENTLKLDADSTRGKATLADVAWLSGHWSGSGLGGSCEEVWIPPLDGSSEMLGMFRFVKDGKTVFTEHCMLTVDGDSLTLKLKHFDAALKGWEEKDKFVEFKLIRSEKDAVYFDGLTFQKNADGGLDAFVAISRNGKVTEAGFKYKLVKSLGK